MAIGEVHGEVVFRFKVGCRVVFTRMCDVCGATVEGANVTIRSNQVYMAVKGMTGVVVAKHTISREECTTGCTCCASNWGPF